MIAFFKKLFSSEPEKREPEAPGRTFNKIFTSKYFGSYETSMSPEEIQKAKEDKVAQINSLALVPKFLRYRYEGSSSDRSEISSAEVVFQKEVSFQHGSMIHVTELSFLVKHEDFEQFETMTGVSLEKDFRDLTHHQYKGEERRKENREG